ncbi:MAG: hypothetical protein D6685_03270 [Bacteroidetes bacterium]|nr:hypothetical protein AWN76_011570 [Rhodothermaceae bacterium RA]RMH67633.1 MAG: hypothetical protein D6685_03270 [Bacteroidota bacterium]
MKVAIEEHILHWLASLGYSLAGRTREEITAMFLREARQWEMAPWELDRLVREGYDMERRDMERPQARTTGRGPLSRPRYASIL